MNKQSAENFRSDNRNNWRRFVKPIAILSSLIVGAIALAWAAVSGIPRKPIDHAGNEHKEPDRKSNAAKTSKVTRRFEGTVVAIFMDSDAGNFFQFAKDEKDRRFKPQNPGFELKLFATIDEPSHDQERVHCFFNSAGSSTKMLGSISLGDRISVEGDLDSSQWVLRVMNARIVSSTKR